VRQAASIQQLLIRELLRDRWQRVSPRVCATFQGPAMGDIEISDNQELDADLTREQPSDRILSQLASATIMLSLELELRACVRAINAAAVNPAPIGDPQYRRLFTWLLRQFATMTGRFPWRSAQHQLRHRPA
jgi:hypothetical protein